MSQQTGERTALVTGGNRGIGREVVRQLGRRGFHVFIGSRDAGGGREAAEEGQAGGGRATSLLLDVSGSDSIRAAAGEFAGQADRLDVLINNAGIYPDRGTDILTVSRELLDHTFQTAGEALFLCDAKSICTSFCVTI